MSGKAALPTRGARCLQLNMLQNNGTIDSYAAVKKIKYLQKSNNGSKNLIKEAFAIYNNLHKSQQNEYVINALLTCCKKDKKLSNDTIKVINHIKNQIMNSNDNNVYAKNTLISVYSQCKDITNATKVFDSIPKHKKTVVSINNMMNALSSKEIN